MKTRKILIPIHVKLISFTLVILLLALSGYAWYAINLFKEDKLAYVFQSVDEQKKQVSQKIITEFDQINASFNSFSKSYPNEQSVKTTLRVTRSILGFIVLNDKKLEKSYFKSKQSADNNWFDLLKGSKSELTDKAKFFVSKVDTKNVFLIGRQNGKRSYWALLRSEIFSKDLIRDDLYQSYILDKDYAAIGDKNNLPSNLLDELNKRDVKDTTFSKSFKDLGHKIISLKQLSSLDLNILLLTDYDKALQASKELRNKSFYFAVLVIGVLIILILIFSKVFTVPIDKLYKMSEEIANKNFKYRVDLKNSDELGVLSDSFNGMAEDIEHYIEEMKEKNRLENELQTAKLVQESFFPDSKINNNDFSLAAYYDSASECGGDWWGHLYLDNKLILIIADVTGHGTPAALMTAILHNSKVAIEEISKQSPEFLSSSAKIMKYLNDSVCSINSNLMATAFVGVFDFSDNQLTYTNASHNAPLKYSNSGEISKESFFPLMEIINPRLGEKPDFMYEEVKLSFNKNDNILFFTDGIIEAENLSAKMYGKRNFLKSLIKYGKLDCANFIEKVLGDFKEFQEEVPANDDITLVSLKVL